MSNLFQKIGYEAFRAGINPRTKQSRDWFQQKVGQLRNINRLDLMKEEPLQLKNRSLVGSMNMFFYDPKHKDTLPYYDKFPLAIIVGPAAGGFYGLNLHYLPAVLRAKFLDALMDITSNKSYDETTKFELSYKMLTASARMKFFKPCYKHYLNAHVKSRFARVPAPEWEIATFLPTADWQKSSGNKVYKDSRNMIR
mgnify:CR=1 FL=1|jgi:hypothetical protein|tara:strand:- start:257 stop:844 length:588 start_codon:yes stop_codon:yes gene_type:complete